MKRASDLAATEEQRDAASRSQIFLRDQLNTGHMGKRIIDSYLIGSYARHTALRPLDDVDIVFIIDPTAWQKPLGRFLRILPPPGRLLKSFAAAIRDRYQGSKVQVQRRSVGLKMYHLSIDAVPAVPHPERPNWIRVPDRNKAGWIDSAPRVHSAKARVINKSMGGRLLPLVRLLKAWNASLPSTVSLKGFAVETIAMRLFSHYSFSSLTEGLDLFFDFVVSCSGRKSKRAWPNNCEVRFSWPRSLPDTAGTGHNLLAGVDGERIKKFSEAARVMSAALAKAHAARTIATAWKHLDKRFPLRRR